MSEKKNKTPAELAVERYPRIANGKRYREEHGEAAADDETPEPAPKDKRSRSTKK